MNNCNQCKYFVLNNHNERYGNCTNDKFSYDFLPEPSKTYDELIYCDHDNYSAFFRVGINFGCIHFEKEHLNG